MTENIAENIAEDMTDQAVLPQWNGHPVPWVLEFSEERDVREVPVARVKDQDFTIGYRDGRNNREASGVLWQRSNIHRRGTPVWTNVNTYRQRVSMNRRRCQVCGTQITDRPIHWLLPLTQFWLEDEALTISPPTCASCVPLVLELCPHMKANPWVIANVLDYRIWGVEGDMYFRDKEHRLQRSDNVIVPYDNPKIPYHHLVAKQQVVELTKFTIEEESA